MVESEQRNVTAIQWIFFSQNLEGKTYNLKLTRADIRSSVYIMRAQKFVNGEKIILPVFERDVYDGKVLFKAH